MGDLVAVFQVGGIARPVRAAGGDPRQPRVGLRGPLRRRGPRPQAPVAQPGRGPAAGARGHGHRATTAAAARRVPRRPASLPAAGRRRRPAARLDAHGDPRRRPAHRRDGRRRRRRCSTAGRRSRTRSRCCSTRTSQAGIVVDRTGAVRGSSRSRASRDWMRESDGAPSTDGVAGRDPRKASCRRPRPTMIGPLIDWVFSHLDDVATRILQHLQLTIIPVVLGFGVALDPSGDLRDPQAGRLRPDHRGHRPALHDPEPRGVRDPRPGLRPVAADRDHPADHVHAADPVPQHTAGSPGRPARGHRGGRGDGLHPRGGCSGSSCRWRCR